MKNILEIKNLVKYYGKTVGVNDVTMEIQEGEIFGFIGPNGAGKSTTIRCIMRLINKSSGIITFMNKELNPLSYKDNIDIGYLPSEINLYEEMTGKEILKFNDSFYTFDTIERANIISQRLKVDLSRKIKELSLGNLKKIGIVLSLAHSPKLIIMDEASSELDPLMKEEFYSILKEEKSKGKTILFSSHNLAEVRKICDRVAIIKDGKIIKIASINELISSSIYMIKIKTNQELSNGYNIIAKNDEFTTILYNGDINKVIKDLSNHKIERILIEEPSLEDVFMHYYK
ncbi:MAG: ABC transporter ATP-binding protein [Bacilli bacterium]|jgi:ABC-2 type transport system ATP-binding protein|nr:ABC transporter ATP-binding protein [Bacilli bacterium]MDD2682374.1 ABC transporter ATP-binding protein [Bacilli bacterium]MDD3121359.1 ABC transporter ATP-binding protein [Bacilli bacterium]MDD4063619.1 ABC transporter ATP-binding protein [Bacilli bacterium]MDD4482051.1 ABC transporter ATP-binding protein [Bacilli bacterium]